MTGTNVPAPTFGPKGFIAPPGSDVLAGVKADLAAAFGAGLNQTTSGGSQTNPTPQGQLAASISAIIEAVNSTFLLYTNLVDPALSYGRMQDGLGRIYFLSRFAAKSTLVSATCRGLVGTPIPAGALARDANGNVYASTQGAEIGSDGTATVPFAAQVPGPIICAAGSLSEIYQAIPGWDSVTNAAAGAVGTNEETSSAFETRRFASVALNSIGAVPSLRAAVLAVDNVIDCYVTDNPSSTAQLIGGVVLQPNSIYVAVEGGKWEDIAMAIWTHKGPGSLFNGSTSATVYDTQYGTPPYPSYTVSWTTPTNLPIFFAVSMANNGFVPSDAASLVQAAIVNAFSGGDGGLRVRIGQAVFAARFYSTLAGLWPNAQVVSVFVGSPNSPAASFYGSVTGTTLTVTSLSTGVLAVGQYLTDLTGAITPGTKITALGTGTGGAGTYVLNATQTVTSESMYTVSPTLSEIPTYIDQFPATAAAQISLALV